MGTSHLFDDSATRDFVGCPAGTAEPGDGRDGVTLISTAPLAEAEVLWRVRGSSGDWQVQALDPALLAAQRSTTEARVADGSVAAGMELIGHCVTIDRDLYQAYELYATGLDIHGRRFTTITATLADLTPEGRPPSVVEVNARFNQATVKSWTTTTGSVHFHWFPLAADEEPPANCNGMLEYPLTRSVGDAFLTQHMPRLQRLPQLHPQRTGLHRSIERKTELEMRSEPFRLECQPL